MDTRPPLLLPLFLRLLVSMMLADHMLLLLVEMLRSSLLKQMALELDAVIRTQLLINHAVYVTHLQKIKSH